MVAKIFLALQGLSFVKVLVLSDLDLFEWGGLDPSSLGSILPQTNELSLFAMTFNSSSDIKCLISGFGDLHRLRIRNTGWSCNDEHRVLAPPTPPSHLSFMYLEECYSRDILDWLASYPNHRLEHLVLGAVASADIPSVGRYVRHVGLSLRHFVFGFTNLDPGGDAGENGQNMSDLLCNIKLYPQRTSTEKWILVNSWRCAQSSSTLSSSEMTVLISFRVHQT